MRDGFKGFTVDGHELTGHADGGVESPHAVAEERAFAEVFAGTSGFDQRACGVGDVDLTFFDRLEGLGGLAGAEEGVAKFEVHGAEGRRGGG